MTAFILLFLNSLRHRWIEYFLAGLAVALLAAALIAQRSVADYSKGQIHTLAHKLGNNMLIVPAQTELSDFYSLRYGPAAMPDTHPQTLTASEAGQHIGSDQARLYANVSVGKVPVLLIGQKDFARGSASSPLPEGGAVLGEVLAGTLSLQRGSRLRINGVELEVLQVMARPPEDIHDGLFTSLATAQRVLGRPGEINAMRLAGCWCRTDVPALARQVEQLLPGTKAITVAGVMKAQKGIVSVAARYSAVLSAAALLLIGAIAALLVSSQVRRQRQEIGLLLAAGTPPALITALFVSGGAVVGALGGIGGCLLGLPLTKITAASLVGGPLAVSGVTAAAVFALSVLIGALAAYVPAHYAAHLEAAQALRKE